MDWRRVLGLAVVLAVLFLGLARPWETPPATRGDPNGAAQRSRQGQGMQRWSVTQGAYTVDHPGETDPVGVVEQPDTAPPPPPPPVTVPVDAERAAV